MKIGPIVLGGALFLLSHAAPAQDAPFLVVLGIAQDGGVPQLGDESHPAWSDPARRRLATSLALVDPGDGRRWLFEATPDLRAQMHRLETVAPRPDGAPLVAGVFLTHAHIGHYTGLMFFGHESLGARGIRVHAMPRMAAFLEGNGPWSQLVRYGNIALDVMADRTPVDLAPSLQVTPFSVPHRQEFSEVVGFRIDGPARSALFLPDIDSWTDWDREGTALEDALDTVDLAFLDATFYADGEVPGRDMSGFPHPRVTATMDRLSARPAADRAKVHFIHLNHTNPLLHEGGPEWQQVRDRGFHVARPGQRFPL